MSETIVSSWVPLAALAAGVVAAAVLTRGVTAAVHLVVDEVGYRAGLGDMDQVVKLFH